MFCRQGSDPSSPLNKAINFIFRNNMVKQVGTLADLKKELADAGDKLVVVDFYATWCGPCKIIAPKVEEMSTSLSNVVFLKVDVDENEEAAQEFNISAMPTFIFLKNSNKVTFV